MLGNTSITTPAPRRSQRCPLLRTRLLITLFLTVASVPFIATAGRTATANNQSNSGQQPAQQTDNESPGKFHKSKKAVKDQYIVVLQPDTDARDVKSLARDFALSYSGKTKQIYIHAIKGFVMQMTEESALAMSRESQVA